MKKTVKKNTDTKNSSLKKWLQNKKGRILIALIIPVTVIALVLSLSMKQSYSINPAVTHSIYTIPENALWYAEVLEPQELYTIFETSPFGKSVIESKAWEKLSGTPEFQKLSNLLYFIELKAGLTIKYTDIPAFLGGSAGAAKMRDGSFLIAAKTNLKSRMGLALVSAFKGENIPLKKAADKKPGAGKKLEGITADTWTDLFAEEQIPFANLTVTKINVQNGFMYLVLVDNYLFVSDSADTLKEALYCAAKPDAASLKTMKGMKEALIAFENGGHIFVYMDSRRSAAAPVLAAFVKGEGTAVVLYPDRDKGLTGDIFATGADSDQKETSAAKGPQYSRIIPNDAAAALYSETENISDVLKSFKTLDKEWNELKEGSSGFFADAGIDAEEYFGKSHGSALVFNAFDTARKKPYPQFSVLYGADTKDSTLLKVLFKSQEEVPMAFQGTAYTTVKPLDKNHNYTPSFFYGSTGVITSNRADCEKYISASKGNRPVAGDDSSYAALGEYAQAPHHIIISIPRSIEAAKNFFYYGAQRAGGYTAVTVDRDIMPLADPLKNYSTLHIALGLNKNKTGRLVLTEKK